MADDLIELDEIQEASAWAAKECQQLLKSRAVQEAFEATEKHILAEWKRAPTPLEREMAWHSFQAFLKWKVKLQAFAERPPVSN